MQSAQKRPDIPEARNRTLRHITNGRGKHVRSDRQDEVTREESLKLVQTLFPSSSEAPPRAVVFAGIQSANNCGWICAHAAETLACQKRGSVCLVDANLSSPSLPQVFGVGNHYGLTDALYNSGSIRDFAKVVLPGFLWLLSCGSLTADAAGILKSDAMRLRIAELRREFDYVLIHCPPLNRYADALAVAQLTDGVVLVLDVASTPREQAVKVTENLRAAHIKILGALLNERKFPVARP